MQDQSSLAIADSNGPMNQTVIYSLKKNEMMCSNGVCLCSKCIFCYLALSTLPNMIFFNCGIWLYVSMLLNLYTHGRIHGFCIKGLIFVGGGGGVCGETGMQTVF
jgi:hypothetical protein